MASRAKSKGSTSRANRRRKPATIDLEAKEVVKDPPSDAKPASEKTGSASQAAKSTSNDKPATGTTRNESGKTPPDPKPSHPTNKQFGRQSGGDAPKRPEFATAASISQSLRSAGFGKILLSAVFGGIVVIGGLGAIGQLNSAGKLPLIGSIYQSGGQTISTPETGKLIEELQSQLDELAAVSQINQEIQPVDLAPLNTRIASLEAMVSELAEASSNTTPDNARLSELENRMNAIDSAIQEIASIELESTASSTDPQISASLIDLGARIGVLEQANDAENPQANEPSERITALEEAVTTLSNLGTPDLVPLETRLDSTENIVASLRESLTANSGKLSDLDAISSELTKQIQTAKVSEKVARSVAANALGGALESGRGLSVPIASIEALTGTTDETRRLAELSGAGIAGLDDLTREFEIFAARIEKPESVSADAGLMEKFLANAKSLVSIKPSGPVDGNSVTAVLSRIRGHLAIGNIQSVDAEWQQLPEDVRTIGTRWIDTVNNRIEALILYDKISTQLAQN